MPAALKAFVCVPELQNTVTPETSGADSMTTALNLVVLINLLLPARRGEASRKDDVVSFQCGDFLLHFLIAKETCAMHVSSWRKICRKVMNS